MRWRTLVGRNGWIGWGLAALAVALATGGEETTLLLRFERSAIGAGEWWRLLTGHLLHLGWSHLVLNLAGLALVWLLVAPALRPMEWLALLGLSALGTSAGLLWFLPSLQWYVGLSGLLHAILTGGALAKARAGDREGWVLLAMVALKLLWEQAAGPLPGTERAAGGAVIVDAHLFGALSGLAAVTPLLWRRRSPRPEVAE